MIYSTTMHIVAPILLMAFDPDPSGVRTTTQPPAPEAWQVGPACGPNALYCMLRILGYRVEYVKFLRDLSPPEQGNSLEELRIAADRLGMRATVYKPSKVDLETAILPYIAHLDNQGVTHHVLVVGRARGEFITWDPENSREIKFRDDKFFKAWSGYILATGFYQSLLAPSMAACLGIFMFLGLYAAIARRSQPC